MSIPPTIHNHESQISERRFWPRETLEWVVLVYFGQNNWGKLIDLSKGGMRFEFAQPASDPGPINFRFEAMGRLPSSFGGDIIIDSFQATGDIRWTSNFERTAGVQFANLAEGSREQIQKWLSFGHSVDSGRSSNETEPEALVSRPEPFEPAPPPETRPEVNEDDMPLEVACMDPGSEPYADSLEDLTSPLVAETPEAPVFQDYSHAMAEEENKNAEASGPYLRLSRTQVTGVLVGMAAAVVIGGLGMILQRLAYRVPSVERAASPVLGEGESVGAEYASAAGSQRPFLVEVLDVNNQRWLLWFDDSSSKNVPTQAAYKSSLPFSTPSLRGASRLKQTAASPKPSEPRKFTLVAPQASRPQVNSSATNSPSLVAPVVRGELQPPLQSPIVDILGSPPIPSPISESAPVGGQVQKARLVKSVPPVYPPFAKSSRVSGNVILDALIDATGNVTELKAISGPAMLRQAAMDAVKHWKYEPARLNGRPVALHLAVTVKFRFE